ncbi:L,D-transpeptidase family protein [Pedobacter sp. AW31-3R]|uniref:L,D-transpeptidase family protein n=1 Tax=Pedobacter sp. AW31-3R TaxID=3445781 RepID=UPI003F9F991C
MKRIIYLIIPVCLSVSSCNWFKTIPEAGVVLSEHFHNKLYKEFDTAAYHLVFNRHLDSLKDKLSNPLTLSKFYANDERKAEFVIRFYASGAIDTLKDYIGRAEEHGFNPRIFGHQELEELLGKLGQNKFRSIAEVYPVVADLELVAASSLLKYEIFLSYGSVNPRNTLNRYYVTVKRPDSTSINRVLGTDDLPGLLRKIQPSSENYKTLQQNLRVLKKNAARNEAAIKAIEVNMERLRWKLPDLGEEYVEVNIPDFSLTWFHKEDTVTHMKVCVGGRREQDYEEKMKTFLKTQRLDDKPKNHQTPILISKFSSIQVNPIWNIPVSIAKSEIYFQALRDPYYLSNNNMKVYYKGQLVNDPDTIQWRNYSREKLPFQFKQGSGAGNALGKFKFIFDNGSSIYLHDTNNKAAFNREQRAISHGCVRVEKPLEFAEKLVDNAYQYDQLRMEVNLPPVDTTKMEVFRKRMAKKADTLNVFQLKPKWFGTKKNVAIFINYKTAWADRGAIQYRNDVYGLDDALYNAMKKFK